MDRKGGLRLKPRLLRLLELPHGRFHVIGCRMNVSHHRAQVSMTQYSSQGHNIDTGLGHPCSELVPEIAHHPGRLDFSQHSIMRTVQFCNVLAARLLDGKSHFDKPPVRISRIVNDSSVRSNVRFAVALLP